MINENQFDIFTLSETWLHGNRHLLQYTYNFVYENRQQKREGEVEAYREEELDFKIREDLKRDFKIREDLNRLDTTIGQLWLETKGKDKKASILLEIV